jgi:hypothetical protein
MRKLFLIGITLVTLSSCYKDAQNKTTEGNGFEVEFLFEKDGVKVYRFRDGGNTHYFTSGGETMTTQSSGKTHYEENIQ